MAPANDIAEFLTSRRAKMTPQQAGLPTYGQRRVPGLRREEVATLAGVSVEYYKRLERGNAAGVSDIKRLHHPVVGDLELSFEVMELPADDGLNISVYSAEPDSRSQEALDLLASWTATPGEQPAPGADSARSPSSDR